MSEAERLLAAALACLPPGTVVRDDRDGTLVARWTAGEQWLTVSVYGDDLIIVHTARPDGRPWHDSKAWPSRRVRYVSADERREAVERLTHGALRRMTGTTDELDHIDDRETVAWRLAMACAAAEAGVIPMDDPRIHDTAAELGVTVERLDQPAGTDRQRSLFDD